MNTLHFDIIKFYSVGLRQNKNICTCENIRNFKFNFLTTTTMNIVKEVLEREQKDLEKFKTIQVEKHIECRLDLGMLMCSDPNELDEKRLK